MVIGRKQKENTIIFFCCRLQTKKPKEKRKIAKLDDDEEVVPSIPKLFCCVFLLQQWEIPNKYIRSLSSWREIDIIIMQQCNNI